MSPASAPASFDFHRENQIFPSKHWESGGIIQRFRNLPVTNDDTKQLESMMDEFIKYHKSVANQFPNIPHMSQVVIDDVCQDIEREINLYADGVLSCMRVVTKYPSLFDIYLHDIERHLCKFAAAESIRTQMKGSEPSGLENDPILTKTHAAKVHYYKDRAGSQSDLEGLQEEFSKRQKNLHQKITSDFGSRKVGYEIDTISISGYWVDLYLQDLASTKYALDKEIWTCMDSRLNKYVKAEVSLRRRISLYKTCQAYSDAMSKSKLNRSQALDRFFDKFHSSQPSLNLVIRSKTSNPLPDLDQRPNSFGPDQSGTSG